MIKRSCHQNLKSGSIEFDQLCCMGRNVGQGGAKLYWFSEAGIEEKVSAYMTEVRREKGTKGAY